MLWVERQFLCNIVLSQQVQSVCCMWTKNTCLEIMFVCVRVCTCVLHIVSEIHIETTRLSVGSPLLCSHILLDQRGFIWWIGLKDSDMDMRSFRITRGKMWNYFKIAMCCSLCMPCYTMKLQAGAQFSCYTQVYHALLMCQKQSGVQWNVLAKLTKQW